MLTPRASLRPILAGIVFSALTVSATHAQLPLAPQRAISEIGFVGSGDLRGRGPLARLDVCATACGARRSVWLSSSVASRGRFETVPLQALDNGSQVQAFTQSTSVSVGLFMRQDVFRRTSAWSLRLAGGIIAHGSRQSSDLLRVDADGGVQRQDVVRWEWGVGPSLGSEFGRRIGKLTVFASARVEKVDRLRYPIGLGVAF